SMQDATAHAPSCPTASQEAVRSPYRNTPITEALTASGQWRDVRSSTVSMPTARAAASQWRRADRSAWVSVLNSHDRANVGGCLDVPRMTFTDNRTVDVSGHARFAPTGIGRECP